MFGSHQATLWIRTCFIAVCTFASLSATAQANGKAMVYPGSSCQPQLGTTAVDLTSLPAGAFNFTQEGFSVTCPVIRTHVGQTNRVSVSVTIRRTTIIARSVNCTFYSFAEDGLSFVDIDSKQGSGTSLVEVLHLELDQPDPRGHFVLECNLPRDYGIVQYTVDE
jgi:hypothetical protein